MMRLDSIVFTFADPPVPAFVDQACPSWAAAELTVAAAAAAGARRLGYKILWADGEQLVGQMPVSTDCAHEAQPLCRHIQRFLAILAGRRKPTPVDEKQYATMLASHGPEARGRAINLLDGYDLGER
jgi:hypothetical protein